MTGRGGGSGQVLGADAMGALHEVAVSAGRTGELDALARLVVGHACRISGGDAAVLRWFEPANGTFRLVASTGVAGPTDDEIASDAPTAISEAFQTGRPVIDNDYTASGRSTPWGRRHEVRAQVAVPLVVEGRPVGTLAVLSRATHKFRESDGFFLSLMAAIVAPALEAARLSREVRQQKKLLSEIYDAVPVAVVVFDGSGNAIYSNTAAEGLVGTEALAGIRARTLSLYREDGAPMALEERPSARALKSGTPVRGSVVGIGEHERRWFYLDAVPIVDEAGTVSNLVTSAIEITELKAAEQRERHDAETLRRLIAVQTELGRPELNEEEVMETITARASELTGAPGASLQILDGDEVLVAAAVGFAGELRGMRLPAKGNPIRGCIAGGGAESTDDTLVDPRCNQEVARMTGIRSLAMAPVRREGMVIGGLQVQAPDAGGLAPGVDTALELLAGFAGAAITRARADKAVRASEQRTRAVIESAPDPIVTIDSHGLIAGFNPAAEHAFLRESAQVIGMSGSILLAPRHAEGFARWIEAGRKAGSAEYAGRQFEATGRRADGSEFPTEIAVVNLPEKMQMAAVFIRDLTLRDRLVESRERLAAVVANAPVIMLACDRSGVITLAEGSGLAAVGLEPGSVVGKTFGELVDSQPEYLHQLGRALKGETVSGQLHLNRSDRFLEGVMSPVRDSEGAVCGASMVLTDVTDRVHADAAIRESEAKSRLMAMMNHEVRTPLNSILGFAQLLTDLKYGDLSAQQRRYVGHIQTSGKHVLALVNESLDLAKLDGGQSTAQVATYAARRIVEQAVDQVRPLAAARDLDLTVACAPDISVRADPTHLLQVLLNLLSNAIRHTRPEGSVHVGARLSGDEVEITVADTGEGIAKDDLGRIFEEFYQAKNHAPGGVGLGLAISRRLVQLMGGRIEVRSELGKGSTFTVRLRGEPTSTDAAGR